MSKQSVWRVSGGMRSIWRLAFLIVLLLPRQSKAQSQVPPGSLVATAGTCSDSGLCTFNQGDW